MQTDPPLIVFQYPLATGQGYPAATLELQFDQVPTIRAIKDWTPLVPQHESQIRALQGRERPVNVLSTNSACEPDFVVTQRRSYQGKTLLREPPPVAHDHFPDAGRRSHLRCSTSGGSLERRRIFAQYRHLASQSSVASSLKRKRQDGRLGRMQSRNKTQGGLKCNF
jgi:hypothetical protein